MYRRVLTSVLPVVLGHLMVLVLIALVCELAWGQSVGVALDPDLHQAARSVLPLVLIPAGIIFTGTLLWKCFLALEEFIGREFRSITGDHYYMPHWLPRSTWESFRLCRAYHQLQSDEKEVFHVLVDDAQSLDGPIDGVLLAETARRLCRGGKP